MVEVKSNDINVSKSLIYFKERLKIPYSYQVVKKSNIDKLMNDVRVISADKFLANLI